MTTIEIASIIEEARDSKYKKPNILHLGKSKTSIFEISQITGLILVNGNQWTGREHIDKRHSLTSRIPYWTEDGKIGNPTKFHLGLAPIMYMAIADQIFQPKNRSVYKNKRPEYFDVYLGAAQLQNLPSTEYTLVVYRGTKIVHTMFVSNNKKPFNKKQVLDLRQGWTGGSYNLMTGIETYTMPYYDCDNIERCKVIVRTNNFNGTDNWYIQLNDNIGSPLITTKIKTAKTSLELNTPQRIAQLDFSNIAWIEKIIKKMTNGDYEFEPALDSMNTHWPIFMKVVKPTSCKILKDTSNI